MSIQHAINPGMPFARLVEDVSRVRDMRSRDPAFLESCRRCPIINLCLWCPAHAHLETGAMDRRVDYFCRVAHARAAALGYTGPVPGEHAEPASDDQQDDPAS